MRLGKFPVQQWQNQRVGTGANRSLCFLKLLFYVKPLHCFLGIFHWLSAQKPGMLNHDLAFLKENTSFFCFVSLSTLVFQLYLPPLAEICVCLGQTVFPPLPLLYAAALLLDPQWQWRGTLVFNLFSHSQILCFQVINLCSPFTACCMPCDYLCMFSVNWWIIFFFCGDGLCLYGILDVYSKKRVRNGSLVMVWVCLFKIRIQIL